MMSKLPKQTIEAISHDILSLTDKSGLRANAINKNRREEIEQQNNLFVRVFFDQYVSYLESGRKPRSGKIPPVSDLREWANNRGLPTDNDSLFALSKAIWKSENAVRPFLAILDEETEPNFSTRDSNRLFETLTTKLGVFFDD